MKIISSPKELISVQDPSTFDFAFYQFAHEKPMEKIGSFGKKLYSKLKKHFLTIDPVRWDFLIIALSVASADFTCSRAETSDGWTRVIELTIAVTEPTTWEQPIIKQQLEKILSILTGDVWRLTFLSGASPFKNQKRKLKSNIQFDCVSLLSGGNDSFVGAIDLVRSGRTPLFVSQVVTGNQDFQKEIVNLLYPNEEPEHQIILNHVIKQPLNAREASTRSRSIIFLAYAVLAAALVKDKPIVDIVIPENGFISINPPLSSGRLSSLSTKTTFQPYLQGLESLLSSVGCHIHFVEPYKFKTKGEMFMQCKDQLLLKRYLSKTTSCGRYSRYGKKHCGRCVPCMVRRAAFYKADIKDDTVYKYFKLNDEEKKAENPRSFIDYEDMRTTLYLIDKEVARNNDRNKAIEKLYGWLLSFSSEEDRQNYLDVIRRGFEEIKAYLKAQGLL